MGEGGVLIQGPGFHDFGSLAIGSAKIFFIKVKLDEIRFLDKQVMNCFSFGKGLVRG